jgi:hypothetical protein
MIKKIWHWIRFGKITQTIKADINGTACEIEYAGRKGKVIGYWAYGYFDPSGPYQG